MAEIAEGSQFEKKEEVTGDPKRVVRRWTVELKLAQKREKDWRAEVKDLIKRYKLKDKKKGAFNILWSNTETLRPAIYNSLPVPDVRRRFRDADPIGKAVSEVLGRTLDFTVDSTNIDEVCKHGALDMLLPGRAVAWVRYVPSIMQEQMDERSGMEGTPVDQDGGQEPAMEETVEWEQVEAERVKWEDFLHGPGDTWEEVMWVARRHRMNRDTLIDKFPECGEHIPLDDADADEVKKLDDPKVRDLFRTATVWEIWNKDDGQVLFISENYKDRPCSVTADPLKLKGFFPCAKPAYIIEDPEGLVPQTHYSMYAEQAQELDEITKRINGLIKSIKANGIYDSRISEMADLMQSAENDLTPAKDISNLLAAMGGKGIESLIWMRPIDMYVKVYAELIAQREQLKQTIYEITGISDILRGMSNASETATAQNIKNQWGTLRIQRMQREFQRWVRDTIRLMAEVISQQFSVETFKQMTGLKYPTLQEKQQAQMLIQQDQMAQQQAQQAPMMGMGMPAPQIDPEALKQAQELLAKPAWEDIEAILRSDPSREFQIDIETDSTIAETLDRDMNGLKDVLSGLVQFWQGVAPAVQLGALPIDAVKEISLAVCRRAKLGMAVEDAIDKMQQPQQQDQSQAAEMQMQHEMKVADIQQKAEIHKANVQAETTKQVEQIKAKTQAEVEQFKAQKSVEAAQITAQNDAQNVREQVAQMLNQHQLQMKQVMDQLAQAGQPQAAQGIADSGQLIMQQLAPLLMKLEKAITAPRKLVRDGMGRADMSVVDTGPTIQ